MKIGFMVLLGLLVCLSSSHQQLRQHHQLPFIDSLGPLETASLMTGDYSVLFPEFARPFIRKILGKEKQQGAAGFLQKAQGFFGSNKSQDSGILGGLGGLFGSGSGSSNNQSGGGILDSFKNAFSGGSQQQSQQQSGGISSWLGFHE